MKTFSFDVKMLVALTVTADSEADARRILRDNLDCADSNFGAWPDGSPILGEASMDGDGDLYEVNGEAV